MSNVSIINSLGIQGIGGYAVSVECAIKFGMPRFEIVGLPDAAVREARERVHAALKSAGFADPARVITINLAPADTKKAGTVYDLPILLAICAAAEDIRPIPPDCAFIGELSLTGNLRPVKGALPMAIAASNAGFKRLFVPADNASEAAFASGIDVFPVRNLRELLDYLAGNADLERAVAPDSAFLPEGIPDFSDVKGQENIKRALEVAAAGGHNVLMCGTPGSGKSMLAKRLPGILPDMTREEILLTTEIHSVCGLTNKEHPIVVNRPFRSPHHSSSAAALSGGAQMQPGEMSLANNGVLFLDEFPEFHRDAIEALRAPIEDGTVTISRSVGTATYPSRFMLVCAMNPCPCGYYGTDKCKCTETDIRRYRRKLSGPMLDRIDILLEVPALTFDELKSRPSGESSAVIKERVNAARLLQSERFRNSTTICNAYMKPSEIVEYCALSPECEELMHQAFDMLGLSARSYDRILRVARTIADLAHSPDIQTEHIMEAVQYRTFDPTNET